MTDQKVIARHYDLISPFYQKLWSNHIHHGYYESGMESKTEATAKLMHYLLKKLKVIRGSKVLDIGCGVGGTSIFLANRLGCEVDGITISPVQVKMADYFSGNLKNKPNFFVKDANNLNIKGEYDFILAIEMISHLSKRDDFFRNVKRLLKKKGRMAIAAWIKESNISSADHKNFIVPIERGMMVKLPDIEEYLSHFRKNGLKLRYCEDISQNVARTWNISSDIITRKNFWVMAAKMGKDVISFLKAFSSMKRGFSSGKFRYYLLVIEN